VENFSAAQAHLSTVVAMGIPAGARRVPPRVVQGLVEGRSLTRALAADLLTHMPELGSPAEQRLLDAWVEQAADTLLALSAALEERLLDVGTPVGTGDREKDPDHDPGAVRR
jgi:hypothetical protein